MFENVDGRTDGRTDRRTDDGRRTTDAGVTGILLAHLRAFGSGELKIVTFVIENMKLASFSLFLDAFPP